MFQRCWFKARGSEYRRARKIKRFVSADRRIARPVKLFEKDSEANLTGVLAHFHPRPQRLACMAGVVAGRWKLKIEKLNPVNPVNPVKN